MCGGVEDVRPPRFGATWVGLVLRAKVFCPVMCSLLRADVDDDAFRLSRLGVAEGGLTLCAEFWGGHRFPSTLRP